MTSSYYSPEWRPKKNRISDGEYTAKVVGLDIKENMRFGNLLADIYKPVYEIIDGDFSGTEVKDNGLFHYRQLQGHDFIPKRNWGYYKFCKMFGLARKSANGRTELPQLKLGHLERCDVVIKVFHKSFVNNDGANINYAVARLVKIEKEIPF